MFFGSKNLWFRTCVLKCLKMSKNCQAIHLTPVSTFFDMLKICLSAASFSPSKQAYDILLKKCMTSNIATRLQSTTLTRMPYRSGSSACWGCSGCSCGGCFFWCILLLGCLHVRWFYTPTSPSPSAPYTLVVVSHVCFVVCVCMCVLSLRASICIPSHCLPLYSAVLLYYGENKDY